MSTFRFSALLLSMSCLACLAASAQSISVKIEGDNLRVEAPDLHFLQGRPFERLRNGATLVYTIKLAVIGRDAAKPAFVLRERFTVSYDLGLGFA